MSKIYLISTPIGNLEDITLRALKVLKEVDFVICEDTRQTLKLLNHFNLKKKLISYHQHSGRQRVRSIINKLEEGQSAALVSDAGTPGVADPGGRLLDEIYQRLGKKVRVFSVPGPSALTAAAAVSGLPCDQFYFLGFLPHKKGRQSLFKKISESKETVIFFESPFRLLKSLKSLSEVLAEKRKVVVCRELTKIHEEIIRGNIDYIKSYFEKNKEKVKGEFVVLVSGK